MDRLGASDGAGTGAQACGAAGRTGASGCGARTARHDAAPEWILPRLGPGRWWVSIVPMVGATSETYSAFFIEE